MRYCSLTAAAAAALPVLSFASSSSFYAHYDYDPLHHVHDYVFVSFSTNDRNKFTIIPSSVTIALTHLLFVFPFTTHIIA